MRELKYSEVNNSFKAGDITSKEFDCIITAACMHDILSDFSGNLFKFDGDETKPLDITIPALKDEPKMGGSK